MTTDMTEEQRAQVLRAMGLAEMINVAGMEANAALREFKEGRRTSEVAEEIIKESNEIIVSALNEVDNPAQLIRMALDERESMVLEHITVEEIQRRDAEINAMLEAHSQEK